MNEEQFYEDDEDVVLLVAEFDKGPHELTERPATVKQAGDPRKDATWTLMPLDTSNGECSQCGQVHEPDWPHNRDSLHYQYAFYAEHDRWPTWADAMAHSPALVRAIWTEELHKIGIEVTDDHS